MIGASPNVRVFAYTEPVDMRKGFDGLFGLVIDSQTLWDQIEKLAQHLQPTYEALLKQALEAGVIYADETRWQMMTKNKSCRWWTWCVATDQIATYRIYSSRSQDAAAQMFGEYGRVAIEARHRGRRSVLHDDGNCQAQWSRREDLPSGSRHSSCQETRRHHPSKRSHLICLDSDSLAPRSVPGVKTGQGEDVRDEKGAHVSISN